MFNIGDMAVYPAHGVGVIESIVKKEVAGSSQSFYVMRMLDNGMIIMIPTENVESVGLRQVMREEDIPKVFEILKNKDVSNGNQTWNRRYREYMEKIKTGSVFEVAEVLRDLIHLKSDKDLSFGERRMLDMARKLLVKELSIAAGKDEKKVEEEIFSLLEV